ncbi:glycoside hydrolase family 10 protein [Kitasatospora sp. NBC_01539]|uniref:glycoside hydrolase family 10 protein n=1 Tax=Kitasatospora sp. NBC_01539 TaxID=2903577 RepID=UPI00386011E3
MVSSPPATPSRRAFLAGCGALGAVLAEGSAAHAHAGATEGATTADGGAAVRRMRGVWIASVDHRDWPAAPGLLPERLRETFTEHLDAARAAGVNAVFVQIRPTADAFWPSPFEPWSQWLTGVQGRDPGFDPLAFMVAAAHARGLAFHGWFNPYRIATHADPGALVPGHPARRHPDWAVAYGGRLYYDPGVPAARAFVQQAVLDAVARYDLDGVHLDDYFYPYPVAGEDFPDDASFAAYGGAYARTAGGRGDWRRRNVDLMIRGLRDLVRAARPEAAFGVSPFGVWRNASSDPAGSATEAFQSYDGVYADTRGWVRDGLLDYVAPQLYWHLGHPQADYGVLARWWAAQTAGGDTQLWIGQAGYKAGAAGQPAAWQDPAELSRHLALADGLPGIGGDILFGARDLRADRIGSVSRLTADHWRRPALAPLLPRLAGGPAPAGPVLRPDGDGLRVTAGAGAGRPAPFTYALRRSDDADAAGDATGDATGGVLTAVLPAGGDGLHRVPAAGAWWTASALDRAGRESPRSPAVRW